MREVLGHGGVCHHRWGSASGAVDVGGVEIEAHSPRVVVLAGEDGRPQRLGHSEVRMTLVLYARVIEQASDASDALAARSSGSASAEFGQPARWTRDGALRPHVRGQVGGADSSDTACSIGLITVAANMRSPSTTPAATTDRRIGRVRSERLRARHNAPVVQIFAGVTPAFSGSTTHPFRTLRSCRACLPSTGS